MSAIKPSVPILMPQTGTGFAAYLRQMPRSVPSPPRLRAKSAGRRSISSTPQASMPNSAARARGCIIRAPRAAKKSRMRRRTAPVSGLIRFGKTATVINAHYLVHPACDVPLPRPRAQTHHPFPHLPPAFSDTGDIRYSPLVPSRASTSAQQDESPVCV